jgi:acyl carrier protein
VLSANWDTWSDTGMAFELAQRVADPDIRNAALSHGITTTEAGHVFNRLLSHPAPQWIISTRNLPALLDAAGTAQKLHSKPDTLHARPALSEGYIAPIDEAERAVIAIWQELLGVEPIGTQDNFFELGGHSLLGTQMMARIRERFGIDLPLRSIFEAPTPASLTSLLHAIPWASGVDATAPSLDMEREEIEL